jgi:flagellin-specific chaperone FliS
MTSPIANPKPAHLRTRQPLTVLFYDQLVQDVEQAAAAAAAGRMTECAAAIAHATSALGYLQATQRPGVGQTPNLSLSCVLLREKLMEAQVRQSRQVLEEIQQQLAELRAAWIGREAETING